MEIVECFVLVVSFLTSLTQAKFGGGGDGPVDTIRLAWRQASLQVQSILSGRRQAEAHGKLPSKKLQFLPQLPFMMGSKM